MLQNGGGKTGVIQLNMLHNCLPLAFPLDHLNAYLVPFQKLKEAIVQLLVVVYATINGTALRGEKCSTVPPTLVRAWRVKLKHGDVPIQDNKR
uniref:Uncharacterized protein n=1 Tax=Solanum lycopersicum TaxID=4081 RepID=A0A3Q7FAH0_SOLLC